VQDFLQLRRLFWTNDIKATAK